MNSLLLRLMQRLGLRLDDERTFSLDTEMVEYVHALAEYEQRPPEEVVGDLLASGLEQRDMSQEIWQRWLSLSPREKEVAALACLDYTYRQIAARLVISPETVKAHMRSVLHKFDLHGKRELRLRLSEWDFSAWEW